METIAPQVRVTSRLEQVFPQPSKTTEQIRQFPFPSSSPVRALAMRRRLVSKRSEPDHFAVGRRGPAR